MKDALFILRMKDHWTAKDWDTYHELTVRHNTPHKEEHKAYKVGDTRTDDCGTWEAVEIDSNGAILWALI